MALAIVCLGSVGLLGGRGGTPSLSAPASAVLVIPLFISELWGTVALGLWPLAFAGWARPQLLASGAFPVRSMGLWAAVQLSSVLWFAAGWKLGLRYQGSEFVWGSLALGLLISLGVAGLGFSCRKKPSFIRSLTAHWLLFAWIVTYAFPYLGETP